MERMWRKVNQGLTKQTRSSNNNTNTINNNNNHGSDSANQQQQQQQPLRSIIIDDGPVYANVPQYNRGWGYIDTSKCRKRRRKIKPRRNSSKEKNAKTKNSVKSSSKNATTATTKETSLRERAVAKLKILNFNINWDVHMKPCGSRVNSNILTRRLCRNRSCDDNELYRSNSFKFERFRRDDMNDGIINTLPKQVNVCDDYSLPVDFIKKRPSSLEHCRDVKFADDFPSPSVVNEQIVPNPGSAYSRSERNNASKDKRPLSTASTSTTGPKVLLNYCEPKDSKKPKHKKTVARALKYSSDSSLPNSTDEDIGIRDDSKYDSSESVADSFLNLNEPEYANQERPKTTNTINPSPYYYADLLPGNNSIATTTGNTHRSIKASNIFSGVPPTTAQLKPKKFNSFLDDPPSVTANAAHKKRTVNLQKRHSITERDVNRCDTFSSTTSDDSNCTECQKRRELRHLAINNCNKSPERYELEEEEEGEQVPSPAPTEFPCNCYNPLSSSMPPHRLLGHAACICAASADANNDDDLGNEFRSKSIFYVHQQGEDECTDCTLNKVDNNFLFHESEMANKRRIQVYETAFDSSVPRCADETCDIEERIRNIMLIEHSQFLKQNEAELQQQQHAENKTIQFNCDYHKSRLSETSNASGNSASSKHNLPTTRYSHSPPSTAPLPIKFHDQHDQVLYRNSIRSAPNLPHSNNTPHHCNSGSSTNNNSGSYKNDEPKSKERLKHTVAERKSIQLKKPLTNRQFSKKCSHGVVLASERVMQLRQSKRRAPATRNQPRSQRFSSTESITSSSGSGSGSMESLHSSASEGNRSSISSGSRHSASLSSHSSDSGARVRYPLRAPVIVHANMNILSPISDKSIQEHLHDGPEPFSSIPGNKIPQSSTVLGKEFGKQNSVDTIDMDGQKLKRRYLQNRASLLLKDEIQGSDSGISLQSRDDAKTKNLALKNFNSQQQPQQESQHPTLFNNSGLSFPEDFANLPFDMPKLRRNLLTEQKQCTSGSATSVDLGDLPFDMPKLKRRLRAQSGLSTDSAPIANAINIDPISISHASSSQSIRDENRSGSVRKNLSLQFNRTASLKGEQAMAVAPTDRGLHLNLFGAKHTIDIDVTIPLERQGWYHGSLTRIEAESTLRPLLEGSFLVRNCESARNDFSLSLKSAKGFMHMRIQQNDLGKFILGEFSQPFDSVPDIIKHFCLNRLPVRGAEHMCLIEPVVAQLL